MKHWPSSNLQVPVLFLAVIAAVFSQTGSAGVWFGPEDTTTSLYHPPLPKGLNEEFLARLSRALVIARSEGIFTNSELATIQRSFATEEEQAELKGLWDDCHAGNASACNEQIRRGILAQPAKESSHRAGFATDFGISAIASARLPDFAEILDNEGLTLPLFYDPVHIEPAEDSSLSVLRQQSRYELWRSSPTSGARLTINGNLRAFARAGSIILGRVPLGKQGTLGSDPRIHEFSALVQQLTREDPGSHNEAVRALGQAFASIRELSAIRMSAKQDAQAVFNDLVAKEIKKELSAQAAESRVIDVDNLVVHLQSSSPSDSYWMSRWMRNNITPQGNIRLNPEWSSSAIATQIAHERSILEQERSLAIQRKAFWDEMFDPIGGNRNRPPMIYRSPNYSDDFPRREPRYRPQHEIRYPEPERAENWQREQPKDVEPRQRPTPPPPRTRSPLPPPDPFIDLTPP